MLVGCDARLGRSLRRIQSARLRDSDLRRRSSPPRNAPLRAARSVSRALRFDAVCQAIFAAMQAVQPPQNITAEVVAMEHAILASQVGSALGASRLASSLN
jgi:hypothetical protein